MEERIHSFWNIVWKHRFDETLGLCDVDETLKQCDISIDDPIFHEDHLITLLMCGPARGIPMEVIKCLVEKGFRFDFTKKFSLVRVLTAKSRGFSKKDLEFFVDTLHAHGAPSLTFKEIVEGLTWATFRRYYYDQDELKKTAFGMFLVRSNPDCFEDVNVWKSLWVDALNWTNLRGLKNLAKWPCADIHVRFGGGETSLHVLCNCVGEINGEREFCDIVRWMLKHKMDMFSKDDEGHYAWKLLSWNGNLLNCGKYVRILKILQKKKKKALELVSFLLGTGQDGESEDSDSSDE